jgi:hypothetical protein
MWNEVMKNMKFVFNFKVKDPNIRKLPYPYLGAISISNDIDYTNFQFFEEFMKFLNTTRKTKFGQGLGLEITSSFFFYSTTPYSFSYFSGAKPKSKKSSIANRMEDYIISGWMDANHAYGDFDAGPFFTREHAIRCYEILENLGVSVEIFITHGNKNNIQNVGRDAIWYHRGDVKGHPAYHVDLMKKHGVKFVWTDNMVREYCYIPTSIFKRLLLKIKRKILLEDIFKGGVQILKELTLQDGSKFKGFWRFRGTGKYAPILPSLEYQLNKIDWQDFYKNDRIIIIYQHLGIIDRKNGQCIQATCENVCSSNKGVLKPFYFLAREYHEGKLWIAGLKRLLNYIDVISNVQIKFDKNLSAIFIMCNEKINKTPNEFFQGLTIYINKDDIKLEKLKVYHEDKSLNYVINPPDETGKISITIPLKRLDDIW